MFKLTLSKCETCLGNGLPENTLEKIYFRWLFAVRN